MSEEIKLRKLKTRDIGPFSRILKKMEIREQVVDLFQDTSDKTDAELKTLETKLAAELLLVVLENYWKAEDEFYKFLSSLSNKSVEEIKDSSPSELVDMLTQLSKDESLESFFKLVA